MKNKLLHIGAILILSVFIFSCDKNIEQENEPNYRYSKTITVENDGTSIKALIETNDENLLNTTLEIEPIYKISGSEYDNNLVNDEYDGENQVADVRISLINVEPNEETFGFKIKTIIPQSEQKTIYTRVAEYNWYDPQFSELGVTLLNDYKLRAVFKVRKKGRCWKGIFDSTLKHHGASTSDEVPEDYYKYRLRIHYTRAQWTVNYYY